MKKNKLRLNPMPATNVSGGDWWWYEESDGIRIYHSIGTRTDHAFFSWKKIKGSLSRKRGS